MKGLYLASAIFAVLISGIFFAQLSLEKVSEDMTKPLDGLTEAVDSGDWAAADMICNELSDRWVDNAVWLSMLIDHSETDLIITTISELSQYEKYRDKPELMAKAETLRELIAHIPKKERVNFENIF